MGCLIILLILLRICWKVSTYVRMMPVKWFFNQITHSIVMIKCSISLSLDEAYYVPYENLSLLWREILFLEDWSSKWVAMSRYSCLRQMFHLDLLKDQVNSRWSVSLTESRVRPFFAKDADARTPIYSNFQVCTNQGIPACSLQGTGYSLT